MMVAALNNSKLSARMVVIGVFTSRCKAAAVGGRTGGSVSWTGNTQAPVTKVATQ